MAIRNYHNVFLSYSQRTPDELVGDKHTPRSEREIEDNVTKALINVLEHTRGQVLESFLSLCEITPGCPLEQYRFSLHEDYGRSPEAGQEKYLVEIIPDNLDLEGTVTKQDLSSDASKPIQDARIESSREVLFIESKIVGRVARAQEHAYLSCYGIPRDNVRIVHWEDIHSELSRLLPFDAESDAAWFSTGAFLVSQLKEYLEILGLSAFSGVRHEHFAMIEKDYESRSPDDARRLKSLQKALVSAIKERIDGKGRAELTQATKFATSGYFRKNEPEPWMTFSEEHENRAQYAHFGCSIRSSHRIDVYVVLEGKEATESLVQVCKAKSTAVAEVLEGLGGYSLQVFKREHLYVNEYKWLFDEPLLAGSQSSDWTSEKVRLFSADLRRWKAANYYPGVILKKSIDEDQAVVAGARLADDITNMIAELKPFRDIVHD